ncbi:MAG TPA: PilZ domain-containing protein, partial [Candidatus Angelobacter sp.]|nr:PilZ domain-containing protein [Candidatus Angelobacter sp.]
PGVSCATRIYLSKGIVDGEDMEKLDPSAVAELRNSSDRAMRHELNIPLRYRLEGQADWSTGEAINMSESGLLFSSNQLLEIDSRVQITFQSIDTPQVKSSTRLARVVRRTLSNWPETRVKFGARFCS